MPEVFHLERRDGYGAIDGDRLSKRFDTLNFVQGAGGKVRLAATSTRPHRDGLDNQQPGTFTKAARNLPKLHRGAPAVSALVLS